MRIAEWCATAIGAAALIQSAAAQTTLTYTVLRANAEPTSSWGTGWASATPYASANNTVAWPPGTYTTVSPTVSAVSATTTSSSAPYVQATGAAARFGMDAVGFAAVAGLVGMVAF